MGDLTIRVDLPTEVAILPEETLATCADLMRRAAQAPITTPDELRHADDLAKDIRAAERILDHARLEVRRRLMEPADRVQLVVAPLIDKLEAERKELAARIHAYVQAERKKQDEEQRRLREEALAKERALHEQALADAPPWQEGIDIPIARVDPPLAPPAVTSKSVKVVTHHRLVIEDRTLVPAYFAGMQIRELKEIVIKDLLKRGASIPGVRLEAFECVEHKP